MATQALDPDRILIGLEGSVAVYRDDIERNLSTLTQVSVEEAEHLVAIAGEDERAYSLKRRASHMNALFRRIDEFLLDDDGGYYQMRVYLASHERSSAVLETWFHVALPGRLRGGTWFRHLIVGIDNEHVFADVG